MTPEELNELDDKRFLEVNEQGTFFRELADVGIGKKNRLYNSQADAVTMNEISAKAQEINDKDAESFKIVPGISEIELGASIKLKAQAIATAENPVPNDPNVAWDSSDWDVAYFTDGGILNAVKVGEVVITAVDVENREVAPVTATITVKDPNVAEEEEEPTLYTITYVADGATNVPEAGQTDPNGEFVVSDAIPVLAGHTFSGWSMEGHEGNLNAGDRVTVSADTTLTAVFAQEVEPEPGQ